jgi:hypothetical protein
VISCLQFLLLSHPVTVFLCLSTTTMQHNYGTRIRNNSLLKPSARLRLSPDPQPPRKHRQHRSLDHSNLPLFPPPNVMLHPEDANSKVFLAIGRSFLSVVCPSSIRPSSHAHCPPQDNRAMTIKDLAEMTLNFGLVCQKYAP